LGLAHPQGYRLWCLYELEYWLADAPQSEFVGQRPRGNLCGMTDLWTDRDLPVLRAFVDHFDDPSAHRLTIDLGATTGLDDDQIARALHALARADPPYLDIVQNADGVVEPALVLGVTERAYRAAGAWPTAEGLTDNIAAAFAAAAEAEADPEQRSKLGAVAGWFGGAGRTIAVDVMTRFVERQAGLG
jgi:hypothetical protein